MYALNAYRTPACGFFTVVLKMIYNIIFARLKMYINLNQNSFYKSYFQLTLHRLLSIYVTSVDYMLLFNC